MQGITGRPRCSQVAIDLGDCLARTGYILYLGGSIPPRGFNQMTYQTLRGERETPMKFRIFVVNLDERERNLRVLSVGENGETLAPWQIDEKVGAWIDLPLDEDNIGQYVQEEVGSSSFNGYKVSKIDCDLTELCYDDDESIYKINQDAWELDGMYLSDDKIAIINALMCECSIDFEEAIDNCENYEMIEGTYDEGELGAEVASRNGCSVDDDIAEYVDWERYLDNEVEDYILYNGDGFVKW